MQDSTNRDLVQRTPLELPRFRKYGTLLMLPELLRSRISSRANAAEDRRIAQYDREKRPKLERGPSIASMTMATDIPQQVVDAVRTFYQYYY